MQLIRFICGIASFGLGATALVGVLWEHQPTWLIIALPMLGSGFVALQDWFHNYTERPTSKEMRMTARELRELERERKNLEEDKE